MSQEIHPRWLDAAFWARMAHLAALYQAQTQRQMASKRAEKVSA